MQNNRSLLQRLITPQNWERFQKLVGVILSMMLWYMSYYFSVSGFLMFLNFPGDVDWFASVLAIFATWGQWRFNRGATNKPTLFIIGIFSYMYSLGTTYWGIFRFQAEFFSAGFLTTLETHLLEALIRILITLVFGFIIEVAPEAVITDSLFGDSYISDFVRSLANGTVFKTNTPGVQMPQRQPQHSTQVLRSNPQENRSNRGAVQPFERAPVRSDERANARPPEQMNGVNLNDVPERNDERRIVAAALDWRRRNGGYPSVRKLAKHTGFSVGKVGPILAKVKDGEYR